MSALAEALVAAQRRAVAVLEKAYVAGAFEDDRLREQLDAMGCSDGVDQDHLVRALDVIRAYGGPLPSETRPANGAPEAKASPAQLARIRRDLAARDLPMLTGGDAARLTKERASAMIDALASPDYDPSEWDVPF